MTKIVIFATAFLFFDFFLVEDIDASEVYYLHQDHLGSTTVITKDGSKVQDVKYYPYGIQRGKDLNTDVTEKGFTGQVKDSQTGLYYYNARYYNPTLAKFTQPDPVADQENRYAYVANNPINITDPTGNMMDVGDVGGSSSEPITRYQKDIPDPCEGNYYSLDCLFGTGSPLMGENYAQNEIDRLIAAGEITVPPPDDPGVALAIIALDLLTSGTLGNFVDGLICATYGPDYCLGVLVPYVPAGAPKIVGNIADDIQADIAEAMYWEDRWQEALSAVMTDPDVRIHIAHFEEGYVDVLSRLHCCLPLSEGEIGSYVAGGDIILRVTVPWENVASLWHEYRHHIFFKRNGISTYEEGLRMYDTQPERVKNLLYQAELEAYRWEIWRWKLLGEHDYASFAEEMAKLYENLLK